MKTKGIAMFQYHREDDTPSPTYENKLGFFNGARVWLVRRLHFNQCPLSAESGRYLKEKGKRQDPTLLSSAHWKRTMMLINQDGYFTM